VAARFVRLGMTYASVAVVGGGLAGLAAATKLHDAGCHVELFERSRLLGGRATSFEVDGHVVDNGQHVYLACCTEFEGFVRRTGMADALYLQDRFDVVAYSKNGVRSELRAANLPPPLHLLASFAGYRHLSVRGKLQIARALFALMFKPQSASEAISFAQWLRLQRQGADSIRSFWEPFMVPALNAPLDRMNAAEAAFVISTAFLSRSDAARFGYSKVPLAQIMDRAAQKLTRVRKSTAVLGLDADPGGIVLRTADEELRFDAVVLALPPRALLRLLGEPSRFGVPPLDVYEPFAIMDVHLWHDAGLLDLEFAALLDSPVQWIFQKAPGYLCCSISAADQLVARPTSEMVALVWDELRSFLPKLAGAQLLRGAATRNPEGTYLAAPGAVRPGPRTALPNVAIAGAWTATGWPDTMESAVRSGVAAARTLIEGNGEICHGERVEPSPSLSRRVTV
jgi:squalene-associated FAD-dependent desaturase